MALTGGLEQLDTYGALDDLPLSLDDPNWDLLFPSEPDPVCGPFTLEQLDLWGNLDSLPYSLDSSEWTRADKCILYGSGVNLARAHIDATAIANWQGAANISTTATVDVNASRVRDAFGNINVDATVSAAANAIYGAYANITATATVDATANAIRGAEGSIYVYASLMAYGNAVFGGAGDVTSSASVSANAIRYRLANADVDVNAIVDADGYRIRQASADVEATASVSALGGMVFSASADVLAVANLTAIANAIWAGYGNVSASADVSVDATKLGDNWLPPVVVPPDNYTPVTPPVDEWGLVAPAIGERFQGGYYAGEYVLNGVTYYIILGDKANEIRAGGVTGALYGVANYQLYVSENDGLFNTNWIAQIGKTKPNTNSEYYKIRQKNLSGTTDWYYPSKNELELIIQNLYPTTTSAPLFKTGGSQALGTSNPTGYWTSSIRSIYNYPAGRSWYLWASETKYGGGMYSPPYGNNVQEYLFYFRPIRKVRK